MNDKIEKLLQFIKELQDKKYTGQLRINFHKGDISNKMTTLITEDLGMNVMAYVDTK